MASRRSPTRFGLFGSVRDYDLMHQMDSAKRVFIALWVAATLCKCALAARLPLFAGLAIEHAVQPATGCAPRIRVPMPWSFFSGHRIS